MHCHGGTINRAPRWTFTDPCKPEVRPGAREESASPAWLAAPAMNDNLSICFTICFETNEQHFADYVTPLTTPPGKPWSTAFPEDAFLACNAAWMSPLPISISFASVEKVGSSQPIRLSANFI